MRPKVSDAVSEELVLTISSDRSLDQAIDHMRQAKTHDLVVMREDEVCGVLSDRDICSAFINRKFDFHPEKEKVSSLMRPIFECIREDTKLEEVLRLMRLYQVYALPVIYEDQRIGIVTESDILRVFVKMHQDSEHALEDAFARSQVAFANPLVQNALRLIAEAGI